MLNGAHGPPQLEVIHVTESFASGVAAAIHDYVRNFPTAHHHLVYSTRSEAAVSPAELVGFQTTTELPGGHLSRIRFLRKFAGTVAGSVVVHAHSSKAGAYVRLAQFKSAVPIVYTPHCYAFERLDVPWYLRQAFRVVEWLLSFNTSCYATCSEREAELSRWSLSRPTTVVVPNVPPAERPKPRTAQPPNGTRLRIAGNGRLGPQKDPVYFAEAIASAARVNPDIEAVWIGGGDDRLADYLRERGVHVTGWLPRSAAMDVLCSCDVYLHSALWEGFPISILEASEAGLPVVARKRPYLRGFDMPIVMEHPQELTDVLSGLDNSLARKAANRRTREALVGNSDALQRAALNELYGQYAGARR